MRILVRGANWIGDAVMTIPAIRELRRIFPDSEISLHTRTWAEGVFRDANLVNEFSIYDHRDWKVKTIFQQALELRKRKFDLGVLLPNSFESALIMKLAGIPRRFGYARDSRRLLLTDPINVPRWLGSRHEVFYYLGIVSEIEKKFFGADTVSDREPKISLPVSDQRKKEAARILTDAGIDRLRPTIAFGVGSTNSRAKRWSTDNFAALNDELQLEFEANVVLVGSADEIAVANLVYEKSRFKPAILTGKTTLAEAAAVLSTVDIMISNDMGLAHVAAAVGTQTFVIFGPTNPVTTRPFSENAYVIRNEVECSPCMLRDCPIDHRCMTRITVSDVLDKIRPKLLK